MGWGVRKIFDKQLSADQRRLLGPLTTLNCAGREYIELLSGTYDFSLYRRTKPWDHAAGALMMVEAGGRAVRFNGGPFLPEGPLDGGIISGLTAEARGGPPGTSWRWSSCRCCGAERSSDLRLGFLPEGFHLLEAWPRPASCPGSASCCST